jgi:ABC-type sugar transport system substrate-binding protein
VPRQSDEFDHGAVVRILRREIRLSDAIRVLVVVPTSSKQIAIDVADIAADRQIPVIALTLPFNRSVFRKKKLPIPPVVWCDSAAGAHSLGRAASLELRQRKHGSATPTVVLIPGEERRFDSMTRLASFRKGMEACGLQPNFKTLNACNWQRLRARQEVRRFIEDFAAPVDVVFAASDEMALGARDAIVAVARSTKKSRIMQNAIIYGFDGTEEVRSLIRENDYHVKGTVEQKSPEMAKALAALIEQLLSGKKLDDRHTVAIAPKCILQEITESKLNWVHNWQEAPPLDVNSGEWIQENQAADIDNVDRSSLRDFRKPSQRCQRAEGGYLGIDRFGRVWRRDPASARIYYLRATLRRIL